jgi:hypothetical protein
MKLALLVLRLATPRFGVTKEVSPSGQGYHWNTNAEACYLIGEAMAKLCRNK